MCIQSTYPRTYIVIYPYYKQSGFIRKHGHETTEVLICGNGEY